MGKYRGSDGWLHDDSSGVGRYHYRDNTGGSPSKVSPETCPNCGEDTMWRRMEGRCLRCSWRVPSKAPDPDSTVAGCLGVLAAVIVLPLVGMGAGYTAGGFGGLLIGLGLTVGAIIAFLAWCAVYGGSKGGRKSGSDG